MKKRRIILFLIPILGIIILCLVFFQNKAKIVDGTNVNTVSYSDSEFIKQLKKSYPEVYNSLDTGGDQSFYTIPGLEQTKAIIHSGNQKGQIGISKDMAPQGIAVIEDKYLIISAYSQSGKYNSVLWVVDENTGQFIKTIALDDLDHVGAITYDDEHDRLWVATVNKQNRAQVEALNLSTIENYSLEKSQKAIVFNTSVNLDGPKLTSYMTYHNDMLYVGYFDQNQNGTLYAYRMNSSGKLSTNSNQSNTAVADKTWATYQKIQGISFYEDNILLSQSYGTRDSKLLVFKNQLKNATFDLDQGDAIASMTLPPYLEQVIERKDKVFLLFESASQKYRNNKTIIHMDRIIKINIEHLYH